MFSTGRLKNLLFFGIALFRIASLQAQVSFETKQFRLSFDKTGRLVEMLSRSSNTNYLYSGQQSFLLSVQRNGTIINPESLEWKSRPSEIVLHYPDKTSATIKANEAVDYISFELKQITAAPDVELVVWGPYPTTIGDTIGEVVGVARNKEFAIGIQALNIKTLGGNSLVDSDIQPAFKEATKGNFVDIPSDNDQLFRGDVAKPMPYGSSLQAYCRNRNKERIIENWGHTHYLSLAFTDDGGVIGSKLAIFGVSTPDVLNTISAIEVGEGLPHPMLDGVWGKLARNASESYLIMDFGESNLQEALDLTKQAGLRYLYNADPFETWGHFKLKTKSFPNNWESLRSCVEKAGSQNIRLGLHTLSNFITTNDPYVTPVPDSRLAKVGYTQLTEDVDATAKDIGIKDTTFFNQFQNNTLRACVIGNEIIRYKTISTSAPWRLLDCQRGAFGTQVSSHHAGDSIGKLMDHAYKVFLGNHELDQEIAKTIARLFNETGLMQISFDGLEGCWSEAMGDYGKQLFTNTWFNDLKADLKGKVINDASNPGHYFWHIYTRMNWGEPWYAGFRESQLQLRLKNQNFFRRNLMPAMLGWFSLRAETSLEDIEWMLARGAGFNAGFGLSTGIETLKNHGRKDEILVTIKLWENARIQGLFTEAQQNKMRDPANEFHLQKNPVGELELWRVYNAFFVHEQKVRQPGEPVSSSFQFNNPSTSQPVQFIITLADKQDTDPNVTFNNPTIRINQQDAFVLPVNLKRDEILYCDGQSVKLYNKKWQLLQTVLLPRVLPIVVKDSNDIIFDGEYSGENGPDVKIEFRSKGTTELLPAKSE